MSRVNNRFVKDPNAILDYVFDWQDETEPYLETGETITAATVTVDDDLTLVSSTFDDTTVTAWISGGTVAPEYKEVLCRITTSIGNGAGAFRTEDRRIFIKIQER